MALTAVRSGAGGQRVYVRIVALGLDYAMTPVETWETVDPGDVDSPRRLVLRDGDPRVWATVAVFESEAARRAGQRALTAFKLEMAGYDVTQSFAADARRDGHLAAAYAWVKESGEFVDVEDA